MEQHSTSAVLHQDHNVGGGTKEIWKVTFILTVLTVVELIFGYGLYKLWFGNHDEFLAHFIKGVIIVLMLAKAFYIVGYFMHLKHEIRNLIMTVVVPLILFVWFIIAFLYEGNSYHNLKNSYNGYYKEKGTIQMEKKEHGAEEHKDEEKKQEPLP
ncbi:MAG: cytochrome C oxidase subunit IV family protein [Panacibacter sp.]